MSPKLQGVFYTIGSAASLSVTFVASKQALLELSPLAFAPLWFAIACGWGMGYYALQPNKVALSRLKPHWKWLLALGCSSMIANYLFFSAIGLGDPTVISFFSRATTIFALLMGVVLLRERMTQLQWLGALIAVTGAGLMTYQGGHLIWLVLAFSLSASFFHALTSYIAKRAVANTIPPIALNIARTGIPAIGLGSLSLVTGTLTWPSYQSLLWLIGGAFLGPFLSYLLFYKGLANLEISQATIIRASQPLFVAFYSFVLFAHLVSGQQFTGGMIILLGTLLMLAANLKFQTLRKLWSLRKGWKISSSELAYKESIESI